jgi:hypothetical protein
MGLKVKFWKKSIYKQWGWRLGEKKNIHFSFIKITKNCIMIIYLFIYLRFMDTLHINKQNNKWHYKQTYYKSNEPKQWWQQMKY